MDLLTILYAAYVMIALAAIAMTIRERMRERHQTLRSGVLGLLACLLWPLTAAYMLVAANIDARR